MVTEKQTKTQTQTDNLHELTRYYPFVQNSQGTRHVQINRFLSVDSMTVHRFSDTLLTWML